MSTTLRSIHHATLAGPSLLLFWPTLLLQLRSSRVSKEALADVDEAKGRTLASPMKENSNVGEPFLDREERMIMIVDVTAKNSHSPCPSPQYPGVAESNGKWIFRAERWVKEHR